MPPPQPAWAAAEAVGAQVAGDGHVAGDDLAAREGVGAAGGEFVPAGVLRRGEAAGGQLAEEQAVVFCVAGADLQLVVVGGVAVAAHEEVRPRVRAVGYVAGQIRAAVLVEARLSGMPKSPGRPAASGELA